MTTHQAIAIAFPLLTAGVMALVAYGTVKWLGRGRETVADVEASIQAKRDRFRREEVAGQPAQESVARRKQVEQDLEDAHRAIDKAQHSFSKAQ